MLDEEVVKKHKRSKTQQRYRKNKTQMGYKRLVELNPVFVDMPASAMLERTVYESNREASRIAKELAAYHSPKI